MTGLAGSCRTGSTALSARGGNGIVARATIFDIAQSAGVSTATVDRVLHGRKGVSAANRQRVFRAARHLGYLPSEGMVALPSRPARLQFLIPFGENAFLQDVADSILGFAARQPLVDRCEILPLRGIGPEALADGLDRIAAETDGIGIITTDHPKTRDAIRRVCEAGLRVVTLASDVPATPRSDFVGVDNRVAGRTAAQILGMLAGGRSGKVAICFGSHAFHGHSEREAGFRSCLAEHYRELSALPTMETGEDRNRLRRDMVRMLRTHPDLTGVYCVGAGRTGLVEALDTASPCKRPFVVMHDLTDRTRRWLKASRIDAVIDQNAHLIGEQAVLRLLGAIATDAPSLPRQHIEPRIILRENIPAGRTKT